MVEEKKKEIPKQQKILLGVLALAGLYVANKYLYVPLGTKIKETQSALEEKQKKLEEIKKVAMKLEKLQREFDIMQEDLKEAEKRLPKDIDMPSIIKTVTKMMEKHGLNYNNFTPSGESTRQYFTEYNFNVTATSSLHGICRFITEIGQLERIFTVKNLTVSKKAPDASDLNTANCNFTIATYVYK